MTSLRRLTDRCETNAWAVEPKGDPLGLYLRSLKTIRTTLRTEVQVNLACLWFRKLSIEDKIPDDSVFCRPRREPINEDNAGYNAYCDSS
jgi:hypothetical protein